MGEARKSETSMYGFTSETVDLAANRERIARISDEALQRYCQAAAFLASCNDRETWPTQLEEARAAAPDADKSLLNFGGFTSTEPLSFLGGHGWTTSLHCTCTSGSGGP